MYMVSLKGRNGWKLNKMDNECLQNMLMILVLNYMEYKEYIIVKAVHQILKIRNRNYKHLDGLNKSNINQIIINNYFKLKYLLKMAEFSKER